MSPYISASSQHQSNFPAYLLGTLGPVWHAEWSPKYHQWVQFQFTRPEMISMLSIRAQAGKKAFLERAPKTFVFQGSHDERSWTNLLDIKDAGFTSAKVWRTFEVYNNTKYKYYRTYVWTNVGDPLLLTIQQIALN